MKTRAFKSKKRQRDFLLDCVLSSFHLSKDDEELLMVVLDKSQRKRGILK